MKVLQAPLSFYPHFAQRFFARWLRLGLCGLCCTLALQGWTADSNSDNADLLQNHSDHRLLQQIDNYHDALSLRLVNTVAAIDTFFGDDRALEESDTTRLRLNSTFRYIDGNELTAQFGVSGRFALPHLQQRFQVVVDADGREQDLRSGLDDTDDVTDDDRSLFAGLRWLSRETRHSRVHLDGGLRLRSGLVPFIRVRGRRTLTYTHWRVRLTQNFLWFEDRGLGQQTAVDFERWLDPEHLFRASPSIRWSEHIDGLDWRQGLSVVHLWREDKMVGFNAGVRGQTRPNIRVEEFDALVRYRQRAYRDWLFFEVQPALSFPRDNDFSATPILTLKVEAVFGEIRPTTKGY